MNQPPDDGNFYNTSTEHFDPQPQQRPAQAPGYPQRPTPPNYPPPWSAAPNQGPLSQHDFPTQAAQNYSPEQGPAGQLDFPTQNAQNYVPDQGPVNQPAFFPQNSQRSQSYPPPQGPTSQPGFSPSASPQTQRPANQPGFSPQGYPQQGAAPNYPGQRPPWSGNYAPPQGPVSFPGLQQQNVPPSGGGFQSMQTQEQRGAPPDWPDPVQSQASPAKKSGRIFMIAVIILALLIAGGTGGLFLLRSHENSANVTPTPATGTATSNNTATPKPTPTAATANGVGTPVQAGPDWLVTVTSVKTTTASLIAPNAGSTYLEISLSMKNVSTRTQTLVGIIQFTLVDASGKTHNEAPTDTNVRQLPYGNVNAGQTLNAQIAYEVPTTQHTFKLSFAYGLSGGNNNSVSWNLSA